MFGGLGGQDVVARVYRAPLAVRSNEGIAKFKREDIYLAAPATDILFTRPLHRFQETVHTESEDTGVDCCRERFPNFESGVFAADDKIVGSPGIYDLRV
ncbi:hypothetical protein NDU88_006349 [Pleurodeles waltl]|uniref:Uncharacterized protein n=1 Tax=Pleurodeles waltl TaxID=8319 RepID=A0AAV7N2R7_PLEWA|nr:hypothetical protein NDU88_006349 [Pleurodeles waltl]